MIKKTETTWFILLLLLSILMSYSYSVSADLYFDNSTVFQVDNENYTFPSTGIYLDEVAYNETGSWIRFNTTDFNITSPYPINITLQYLHPTPTLNSCMDVLLEFDMDISPCGQPWFNLSGFRHNTYYDVLVDDAMYDRVLSDASGIIHYRYIWWCSEHNFKILKACNSTGYEYGNWSFSEHINNTGILEEEWVESNNTIWYVNDSSAWWNGNYTYAFNATDTDFDITLLNNSGMNRTQLFGWTKINLSEEGTLYPMIIFNYQNNNSFDAVLFSSDEVYVTHWNGTNLTDVDTGFTWAEQDLVHVWTNHFSQWEGYYPDLDGCYFKLLYNTYPGELKFKYWGPGFMEEPVGWATEYQHVNLSTNDSSCFGLGGWNPDELSGTLHFDLFNSWQLNYTVNSSATITFGGETYPRPHMEYPVFNMSTFVSLAEYLNYTYSGNFSAVNAIRDVMKDNITNLMNLESRMWEPFTLEALDQNDTIYYYSCLYDEMLNFTEEVTGEPAPSWLYDEYLHLQVQACPDGDFDNAGAGVFYDDLIIAIDVDDDGSWDDNDRLFWMGADGLREQMNGDVWATDVDFNASVWLSETDAVGNLHRYESYMNYGFNLPLATLVKNNSNPLNVSDVFGLCIIVFDDGAETCAVWQNWNETSGEPYYPELTDMSIAQYFLGYDSEEEPCFDINSTYLGRWGEGVIYGGDAFNESKELTYHMNVDVAWNDTVALAGEDWCLVNMSVIVNNTGTGTLTDIWLNQTWWNCSCADLNMTFVDSNLSHTNFTWYNDSCYWLIHNESLSIASGVSWMFWVQINITNCTGVTSATETVSTVGNASELTGTVTSDDGISFAWGYQPVLRVSYNVGYLHSMYTKGTNTLSLFMLALMIMIVAIILGYLLVLKRGE